MVNPYESDKKRGRKPLNCELSHSFICLKIGKGIY
jgi:hypothetical protein